MGKTCTIDVMPRLLLQHEIILQVGPFDRISIKGITEFQPGKPFTLEGKSPDGKTYSFPVNHTLNEGQFEWFKNGSALNAMAAAAGHK